MPSPPPVNPPVHPHIPLGSTAEVILTINCQHDKNRREFAVLINSLDEIYYETLADPFTGMALVPPREILEHIYSTYCGTSVKQSDGLSDDIRGDFDPSLPLETTSSESTMPSAWPPCQATPSLQNRSPW
mmetsp:Transcript_30795/g.70456  ORF Transcript_30795/g.70456 Transcript_30795/m.70456 type:complete len:130 (-) Transcript_30795:117-506(-)